MRAGASEGYVKTKSSMGFMAMLGLSLSAGSVFAGPVTPQLPLMVSTLDGLVTKVQQVRDAEVYYDGQGNEVLVDSATGQVISVRPARRPMRRQQEQWRRVQPDDGYYVDRRRESRRRAMERDLELYLNDPNEHYGSVRQDPYAGRDVFPEAPRERGVDPAPDPRFAPNPKPVQRKPLPPPTQNASKPPVAAREPVVASTEPGSIVTPGGGGASVTTPAGSKARETVAALQVLLDRAGASPGAIDGQFGSNVDKAIVAYRALTGRNLKSTDSAMIQEQLSATGGEPFKTYTLTAQDVAGPFVASVPEDYSAKAKLDRLSYTSVPEMLAERFHMDEKFLRGLNPEANFSRVGTIIKVANVGANKTGQVARIVADKGNKQVRALDVNGRLIVAYPATIGSSDTPSPTGVHEVSRVAIDPQYTYNPKINFKQGENDKVLTIPPGPNGPVGSIWIALDKPTYGIHGTPEPTKIGKTESHGCVRLTNWDAAELAKLVTKGVPVEFLE